jgi:hypothetical protein
MDSKIQEIITDLFKLDPNLKEYEGEITKIINEYMASKPDTKFDMEFARGLKTEILNKIAEIKKTVPIKKSIFSQPSFIIRFTYSLASTVVILLILFPVVTYLSKQDNSKIANDQKLKFDYRPGISNVAADHAFGQLNIVNNQSEKAMSPKAIRGDGLGASESGSMASGAVVSQDISASKIMPPDYETINYKYVYKGDEIKQDKEEMLVYKRVKAGLSSTGLTRLVTGSKNNLVDLSKFSGAEISNINLIEDRDYGYMVSLNFTDGIISIYQNWAKWPRLDQNCRDEACFNSFRIKYEDVPADDNLIAIADAFIKDYGIDMTPYGQPYVSDYFRQDYLLAKNKSEVYIPEEITVNYPLVINNEKVYDDSGNPAGLSLSVNFRQNKVSNLNELKPQNYESSNYKIATSTDKILAIAERGGLYLDYQNESAAKTVEIELGTPALGLMRYYLYDNVKQNNDELYIPCYIFPINNISDKKINFYKKNIVVPLAEDVIREIDANPIPEPMPLMDSQSLESPSSTIK